MKAKLWFEILLMSGICVAQSNPTTFTNTNKPNPEPTTASFSFDIATEGGKPVSSCPSNSAGCVIYFANPVITLTLPDISNQYVNHDTLDCGIKSTVITGTYGCQTSKCQSITYTATGEGNAPCADANGRVWTLVTTQHYHWLHDGRRYIQVYDGGNGTLSH